MGCWALALLSHQLGYFNILPLYIVLMLWAPVVLALALRGPHWLLTVSIGLYAAARGFGLNLPNWPEPGGWFFNPIAWQLIFTLGLVSAMLWRDGPPRPAPWLLALSAVTVAGAALIVTDDGGLAPGLRDTATAHLDVAKQDLGLGAPHPFRRLGLSDRDGDSAWAVRRAHGPRRLRQRGSKPRPQQPGGLRRRLVLERMRPGRARRRFTPCVGRG